MEIEKEIITFEQVKQGYVLENDLSGVGAYTLTPSIVKTFLSNPSLDDYSKCMILFCRIDGKVAARSMFFPSRVRIEEDIVRAQGGSSLFALPEFRHLNIGLDLMRYPIENKEYPLIVYAGISKMAVPMYKAQRFNIFSSPEFWQPRKSKFLFQHFGAKGLVLKALSVIGDFAIKPILGTARLFNKKRTKQFTVNRLTTVPVWVDDIIRNDPHKYTEYHDHLWMQWTIDNNFFAKKYEEQGFYEVKKGDEIVGYFLMKIRNLDLPEHNIDQVVFGTVYEWGTVDDSILNEFDIYCLAERLLPKCVDIFNVSTPDDMVNSRIKRLFMIRHGETYIVTKDVSKKYPDSKEQNNWRLRMGYSDVPFY